MISFFNKPRLLSFMVVVVIFLISVFVKIFLFVNLTVFDYHDDTALFWTESAFQYRYARMVAHKESIPSIDYQVQYPEGLKVFSHITIAMELVSGYLYQFFAVISPHLPFHVFIINFISVFSSLSIFAVYFTSQEVWDNRITSVISSAFYAFSSVSLERTIGHFSREDFTLPFIFFGLFFFLMADSNKEFSSTWLKRKLAPLLSGVCIFVALSSWHFTRFYFFIFILLVIIVFFMGKENKLLMRKFGVIVLFSFIAGLIIPVLREKSFITSYPMIAGYCLVLVYCLRRLFNLSRGKLILIFLAVSMVSSLLIVLFTTQYLDYSHVYSLLLYKLRFFGIKPSDPHLLPYSARVLWIEAFNSPSLWMILYSFSSLIPINIISLFLCLRDLIRKEIGLKEGMLLYFTMVFLGLYLLITRMSVFLIFFLSIIMGRILYKKRLSRTYLVLGLLFLCLIFEFHKSLNINNPSSFRSLTKRYLMSTPQTPPYGSLNERLKLIDWVRRETDENDVILTWFGTGPMIITDTGRSIVLHSKFESEQIRRKYKEFAFSLFESEENFLKFCQKYQVDYFLYEAQFVLDRSKDSIRYLTDQLQLKKEVVAYKFHFEPEKLKHFTLACQNSYLRLFKVNAKGVVPKVKSKKSYQVLFDINQFKNNPQYRKTFDDSSTSELIRKRYFGKRVFVRGVMHQEFRRFNEAIKAYQLAIKLVPDLIEAYLRLGDVYCKEGLYNRGINVFKKAMQLDPNQDRVYSKLAWVYATSPNSIIRNGDEAVVLATKACELTVFKKAEALDALAAAYAEQGNFNKAVEYQYRAIEIAPPRIKKELQKHLQLYKLGRAYRDQ